MGITTIVLDFGNVVGFFNHRRSVEQLARYAPQGCCHDTLHAFLYQSDLGIDYDIGRVSTPLFIENVRRKWELDCTEHEFRTAYSDIFTPNEEVCQLIPRLAPHYRLVLLSNTNDLHAWQFRQQFATTLAHFDALVMSHEVGVCKPDPTIYAECQEHAGGVPPSECLFMDDLPANVEAARACGWQAIHYQPGNGMEAELHKVGVLLGS